MSVATCPPEGRYKDGRDEMNLADFPISVLQRQQPVDEQGVKRDTATYEASRYDPRSRQRLQQRVILETSSRYGLPTPADENVVLALLYLAKHTHDFRDPVVHFAPRQLFQIMGWAPNSRSYDRLREVLRRLKALVIRYENSWWDIAGRGYEAEVATGILAEYELVRQASGRKKGAQVPPSWVCWTPHFQKSLSNGNLKKLDLERLFALRLPTSQRMYRFLDKRFYQSPWLEMDLRDFACGHIGLSDVDNIAELKRRLLPAVAELEKIGFIAPADPEERFQKVRAGVWRVRFRAGGQQAVAAPQPAVRTEPEPLPLAKVERSVPVVDTAIAAGEDLVAEFYRAWGLPRTGPAGEKDRSRANEVIGQHGEDTARALIPCLVQVVRRKWPDCKSFSGAVDKYLLEAVRLCDHRRRRQEVQEKAKLQEQKAREEQTGHGAERRRLEARWDALPDGRRRELEQEVLRQWPEHRNHPGIVKSLCLSQLARLGLEEAGGEDDGAVDSFGHSSGSEASAFPCGLTSP